VIIELIGEKYWPEIKDIYRLGIETGNATFETVVPSWEKWVNGRLMLCSVVGIRDNQIVGWASVSKVSSRYAYKGVGEVSVYVHPNFCGLGIGKELLTEVILRAEENGMWTLQASIFPENKGSMSIFQKKGFRKVGVREKIGRLNGMWRDVILLERRSTNL
jgi:L-amino acid N-acyltransferase YncA